MTLVVQSVLPPKNFFEGLNKSKFRWVKSGLEEATAGPPIYPVSTIVGI